MLAPGSIALFSFALPDGAGFSAQRVPGLVLFVPADALPFDSSELDAEERSERLNGELRCERDHHLGVLVSEDDASTSSAEGARDLLDEGRETGSERSGWRVFADPRKSRRKPVERRADIHDPGRIDAEARDLVVDEHRDFRQPKHLLERLDLLGCGLDPDRDPRETLHASIVGSPLRRLEDLRGRGQNPLFLLVRWFSNDCAMISFE